MSYSQMLWMDHFRLGGVVLFFDWVDEPVALGEFRDELIAV